MHRKVLRSLTYLLLVVLSAALAGCGSASEKNTGHAYPMASLAEMPAEVQDAPAAVQQAYQFAVANPEVLTQIPCYCGCGAMGHDSHALGCSICVDITLDTMRMLDEGQTVPEIKATIDQTYAQYGPSNMP